MSEYSPVITRDTTSFVHSSESSSSLQCEYPTIAIRSRLIPISYCGPHHGMCSLMKVLSYRTLTGHYSRKGAVLANRRLSFRRRFLRQQKKLPPSDPGAEHAYLALTNHLIHCRIRGAEHFFQSHPICIAAV